MNFLARRNDLLLALSLLLLAGAGCQTRSDYSDVVRSTTVLIEREMAAKELPSVAIALVVDQQTVWAQGFGEADPAAGVPASATTVYRVGSVSKLFTDLAVMQLVEQGRLDLDKDVREYVPDLSLDDPFGKPVTLRHLMAHRSGLVREPPVGSYFDPDAPSLAETIASLNGRPLVYEPESRVKYSNAGIALVGHVLERATGEPFAPYVKSRVLDPLGMTSSDFAPSEPIRSRLAKGEMWTYDGRKFEAPTFPLGISPAGSLYSTVGDLASFLQALFRDGAGIVSPETLHAMYEPQFAERDPTASYGLGFSIGELDGEKLLGHGGAIYGFSTELLFLPERKLGVVAVASKDFSNSVVERIARHALRGLKAGQDGTDFPEAESTEPLPAGKARELAGRYEGSNGVSRLIARGDRLFLDRGPRKVELRQHHGKLVVDSPFAYGTEVDVGSLGERVEESLPPPPPGRWEALVGEYGWDHDTLYVLEKDGRLYCLIEWFESYPLEELAADRFRFPDSGLYAGEELVFERDVTGAVEAVVAGGVRFARRAVGTEEGETFRIEPLHSAEELRPEALAASPPREEGDFREPDLVEPVTLEPGIHLDIRYATTNNFMGSPFYDEPRAFLQRPAAEALVRAHRALAAKGYGVLIHDAYRPWYVTKMFWDATPEPQRIFVADPKSGSRHNRGCAVDMTLYELATGRPVRMVGGYDEFSPRSFPDYPGGTSRQRFLRELLRKTMEAEGFEVYEFEWWHFDYRDWSQYPISNVRFDEIAR